MSTTWSVVSEAPLYHEHLLLGGIFDEEDALLAAPLRYGGSEEGAEREAHASSCGLTDLSGMSITLVSGERADAFAHAVCACEPLPVGSGAFGAVVTGDGQVAGIPLVTRTGDHEYLICDVTERGLAILPWMSFLANIEQQGYRPFEGVCVEDVSDSLHPLLLWGPMASRVLADYLESAADLPLAGNVAQVTLDQRIHALAISVPMTNQEPCYLLLVPPASARVLWRSFLSFGDVTPVGTDALAHAGREQLTWLHKLLDGEMLPHDMLRAAGLVRSEPDYVGARALVTS